MDLEDMCPALKIGETELHSTIQTSWSGQRRVQSVRSVGCHQYLRRGLFAYSKTRGREGGERVSVQDVTEGNGFLNCLFLYRERISIFDCVALQDIKMHYF